MLIQVKLPFMPLSDHVQQFDDARKEVSIIAARYVEQTLDTLKSVVKRPSSALISIFLSVP